MAKVARAARNASLMRVETITPSADGTVSAPTKTIADAETGEVYFINISANTCVVKLPPPRAGMYFKFILATVSNNEASKDFAIITDSTSTDFGGTINVGETLTEVTENTSTIQLDNSAGSFVPTVGDFIECISDGTDWYVSGQTLVAGGLVLNDNHVLA